MTPCLSFKRLYIILPIPINANIILYNLLLEKSKYFDLIRYLEAILPKKQTEKRQLDNAKVTYNFSIQSNIMQCNIIQYNIMQFNAIQYNSHYNDNLFIQLPLGKRISADPSMRKAY